ncbi:MAG: ankyrin repeat domain-containing protein [Acidimicrobiia bacterium]|nr:ankyrin repeat domain-containing protein [Acidimicrobiia bacterium]
MIRQIAPGTYGGPGDMRTKRLLVLFGLVLVAAACGGSDAVTAPPDDRPLEDQFVEAIRANDGTRIEALVDAGLDVNANLSFGSAINLIAATGNYELVAVVVAAGFDLDAQNSGAGRTVLHAAAESGDLELISALVEVGANLEGVDDTQQNTPVQYAFYFGQVEAAKLLISLGADINYVDITGRNTADMAIKGGFPESVAFAEELGLASTSDE